MKKIYTLIFAVLAGLSVFAQDIHFSQVFNAPLWLNPALTGFTPGVARVGVNYRNQWYSANNNGFFRSPFMTTALNFDMPIKINDDALGVGLFVANDQQGANTFTGVSALASVSFIKTLGSNGNHRISAGVQGGYTYQSIKTQDFQFANQFQDNQFVSTIPSNELIGRNNVGYVNLNAGLFYYGLFARKVGFYTGASFYNVTFPKYDILADNNRKFYWRWNVHSGLDIILGEKFHLLPAAMFTRQSVNDQLNIGLGFGYDIKQSYNESAAFTMGVYNRIQNITAGVTSDAVIPYVGFAYSGFKIGLSYDATISNLRKSGTGIGGLEIHLGYTIKRRDYNFAHSLICPRF